VHIDSTPSPEHGRLVAEVVPDSYEYGFMDLYSGNIFRREELDIARFAADGKRTARYTTGQAYAEFLPDFTVVVGEYVARIRIDTHNPLYPDIESGFFAYFPYGRIGEGLSDIHGAAGEGPVTGIAAALEKDTAVAVRHYGRRSHYERIRRRRGRVVIKINAPHS
jgi:hypothetical protein